MMPITVSVEALGSIVVMVLGGMRLIGAYQ